MSGTREGRLCGDRRSVEHSNRKETARFTPSKARRGRQSLENLRILHPENSPTRATCQRESDCKQVADASVTRPLKIAGTDH